MRLAQGADQPCEDGAITGSEHRQIQLLLKQRIKWNIGNILLSCM
jgi:hypothetical protein